jgi:ribonucleoside-diphosphate reductase alpha chain/ribonucleoside-triphosphate reductase
MTLPQLKPWSNLARVVYKRTYARAANDNGVENWSDTVERVIGGNVRGHNVSEQEIQRLRYFMLNRKAIPAGRGLWYSGSEGHGRLGGVALNNCWFLTGDDWFNFVIGQDLLMLGGGVGMSVEHRFVSKLPRVRKNVVITHRPTKDADFIVPDSREGWCELTRRVLEAFFVTGKGFTYSTVVIRPFGEPIKGFGGVASGPKPLVAFIEKLVAILIAREGRNIRPIDAADVLCSIAEMVVAGNVRRSALIILGDCWDKEYLKAKRWDLGDIPTQRANANFSVVCDDIDDLHPLFWKTYEAGEPFGIVNRKNIQTYGRMGEKKRDTAVGVNPCAEACLEDGEPCNLQEIALPNLESVDEFEEAGRLMHRYGKRVTLEKYHHAKCDEVVKRNRRIGTGITGCLEAPNLFNPEVLDRVYGAIQEENRGYSAELSIPESMRTTVIKPSGTVSKLLDVRGEGLHPGYSRYMIQRVRFAATDPLVPKLRAAGHHMEPVIRFDGSIDHSTMVVDFYIHTPESLPCADEGWTTWRQLDTLLLAQKHWADQAVSVTVYYKREELAELKQWLGENLKHLKTISFLCHNEHGFKQAPNEAISQETYEKLSSKIVPIEDDIGIGGDIDGTECEGGACPIR